jgi:beta-galactosidase
MRKDNGWLVLYVAEMHERASFLLHTDMRYPVRLLLQLLFGTLFAASVAAGDGYTNLAPDQYASFMSNETRKVYDLSGSWQVIEDGKPVADVRVPIHIRNRDYVKLRKTVKMEQSAMLSHTWHLHMLGAVEEVELFVNGRYIMRYPGGMAPFMIRLPDGLLQAGQNTIELGVSRLLGLTYRIQRNARSSAVQRMGLLREVFLIGTPHVWTEDMQIRSSVRSGVGTINVKARIKSGLVENITRQQVSDGLSVGSATVQVEAMLIDRVSKQVIARSGLSTLSIARSREVSLPFTLNVYNPIQWTLSNPHLYDLVVHIDHNGMRLDTYTRSFGFRTVSVTTVDGVRKFTLNDSVIRLHSIDYIEDYPERGASMSYGQFRRDVSMLKTLGVNAVRIRHSVPHPVLLDLCDQYGIMVMVETPLADVPTAMLKNDEVVTRCRNAAERISLYVESHPSVMAIGISDGLDESSAGVPEYHRQMLHVFRKQTSKQLYKVVPSSLLNSTSEGGFDFIVIKFYSPSDSTVFSTLRQDVARMFRNAAVLAEFGTAISPMNLNGFSDPLSNEAQALNISKFYNWSFTAGLAGVVVWSFNDYTLDRPTMLVDYFDSFVSTSGLVDVYRQRRVGYDVYKALINDEKLPLLQARDNVFTTPFVFIIAGLLLALAIAFTANQSRRFREYVVRAVLRPYNFYSDIRDQRILSISQTTLLAIVLCSSVGLVMSSFFFFIRVDPAVEYLLHILLASDGSYEVLRYISWHPEFGIISWTVAVLVAFVALASLLRVGAMFVRGRIYMRDTFTIVVWSSLPLLALLPIGIGLYQALSTNQLSVVVPLLMFGLAFWSIIRVLRATAVVFDVRSSIVYLIGLGVFSLIVATAVISWEVSYDGFAFLGYYLSVVS